MNHRGLRLTNTNGGWFRRPTLQLSTVRLPFYIDDEKYETCLFSADDCQVIDRYATLDEAVIGHASYSAKYGLTNAGV